MSDCRFGVSPVNYPDPDPDPEYFANLELQMPVATQNRRKLGCRATHLFHINYDFHVKSKATGYFKIWELLETFPNSRVNLLARWREIFDLLRR